MNFKNVIIEPKINIKILRLYINLKLK